MVKTNQDDTITLPPCTSLVDGKLQIHLDQAGFEESVTSSLERRAQRAAATRAGGIPPQFAHAWAWAADWVASNGVTLPPDTNEYRSLRNWFSYQVNAFKKGTLSERSKTLLAKYDIDLSLYRAPNTGRGTLIDDSAMIHRMAEIHAISGSYDMPAEAPPELIQWQARLLECFRMRGTSARMRAIEASLPGLRIGTWLRPDETPIPARQLGWWARAQEFRNATAEFQAYAGVVDPRTPAYLTLWAFDQRRACDEGVLTLRQKGELRALGLLANQDAARSRQRAGALAQARAAFGGEMATAHANRDRSLKSFAGVCLYMRMAQRNAPLRHFYAMFALNPVHLHRVQSALNLLMVPMIALATPHRLGQLRAIYAKHRAHFDIASNVQELPEGIFGTDAGDQALRRLADLAFEVREQTRALDVRQDLPNHVASTGGHVATLRPARGGRTVLDAALGLMRPAQHAPLIAHVH